MIRRICIALIAIAFAACTRLVVLTPSPDGGSDGQAVPDSSGLPDAFVVQDAGVPPD